MRIGLVGASRLRSFKNQSFKSQLFSSSQLKNTINWNHGSIWRAHNSSPHKWYCHFWDWYIWYLTLLIKLKLIHVNFFGTLLLILSTLHIDIESGRKIWLKDIRGLRIFWWFGFHECINKDCIENKKTTIFF